MTRPNVFLALPGRPGDQIAAGLLTALFHRGEGFDAEVRSRSLSLLTTNFNLLWCDCLNQRPAFTHFAMVHADVVPEPNWLANLLAEQRRVGADILSACIPLKDDRGLTSTGVMDWRTRRMRKFTVAETLALPRSFTAADAGYPGHALLMNTGLWVCDFTRPWVERMCFRQADTIVRQSDGQFRPAAVSEDWLFSLDAARLGLRCLATTAVRVKHVGIFEYPNYAAFGAGKPEAEEDSAVAWNIDPPPSWGQPEPKGYPPANGSAKSAKIAAS